MIRENIVIGGIYKHPKTTISEFTNYCILPLLEKLLFERKRDTNG